MKCTKCSENVAAYFISRGGVSGGKIGFCETCSEDIGIFAALRKVESLLHGYGVDGEGGLLVGQENFPVEFADGCRRCGTDLKDFERRFSIGCEECAVVFGSLISNYLSLFGAVPALASYPGTPPSCYLNKAKACQETIPLARGEKICKSTEPDVLKPIKSCRNTKEHGLPAISKASFEKILQTADCGAGKSSSRLTACIELRRNFADITFPTRMTHEEMHNTASGMQAVLPAKWMSGMKMLLKSKSSWYDAHAVEAKLYGRKIYPGATVAANSSLSKITLFNNMDHITLVSFTTQDNPEKALQPLLEASRYMQDRSEIAYSGRFGFLTAAPRHLGSGLSVSIFLHLPYSLFRGRTYEFPRRGIDKAVQFEPLSGNNFEQHGFFRISSTLAFGRPELDVVDEAFRFADELEKEEDGIRAEFNHSEKNRIENIMKKVIHHAAMSYRLSYQDALRLTSFLQIGVDVNAVDLPAFEIRDVIPGLSSMYIMRAVGRKLTVNECEKERAEHMAALLEKWSGLIPVQPT